MANSDSSTKTDNTCTMTIKAIEAVMEDFDASDAAIKDSEACLDRVTLAKTEFYENQLIARGEFLNRLSAELNALTNGINTGGIAKGLKEVTKAVSAVSAAKKQVEGG